MKKLAGYLSLFTSFSTLLCCALPSLMIFLGMGVAMAGISTSIPGLITLTKYKDILFIFGGLMLGIAYFIRKHARKTSCPIDKKEACNSAKEISNPIFYCSVAIYVIGLFFSYALPLYYGV